MNFENLQEMTASEFDQISFDVCELILERTKNKKFTMDLLINCFLSTTCGAFYHLAQSKNTFEQCILTFIKGLLEAIDKYDTVKIKGHTNEH